MEMVEEVRVVLASVERYMTPPRTATEREVAETVAMVEEVTVAMAFHE